jgi:alpha-1,3-glucosyltransferase
MRHSLGKNRNPFVNLCSFYILLSFYLYWVLSVLCFVCRKLLMRWTVLSSDLLIFFPAVLYFVLVYYGGNRSGGNKSDVAWHIAVILINPCLILTDHGHFQVWKQFAFACLLFMIVLNCEAYVIVLIFYMVYFQYNCISLGLTLGAVAAVLSQKDLLACVLFCLSLNHKQVLVPFFSIIWLVY